MRTSREACKQAGKLRSGVFIAVLLASLATLPLSLPVSAQGRGDTRPPNPRCVIKGNISIQTGEKIYHVPGQKYYTRTRISPAYGERWFCSEAEARAAGWRKSKV
ncbi:MAG: hypothetical protein KDK91_24500 [Gammaproteobacteria bacterium]|nr:hypothetical protein [Gammaproteobacteria bacterium]